ncbi:uncharacterized protein [Primulina eburnea]|uniref:uncharacterized protein isoform X2 n=1 Tax=Primulina eburnea TaxID=1245227 RepID=UPI003C6CB1D3
MPTSAPSNHSSHPEYLIGRLNSAITPYEAKLKDLRDLKNQIIGNRTKKLAFLKLGAVPSVASILSDAVAAAEGSVGDARELHESVLIQSAAAIGSFACGLDAGVKAVLDVGAFPLLLSLISHVNDKVVDAGARSLKLIYQSKLAPKYDFIQEKNMEFLLSLLNSENENVTGLGASIVAHSCQTIVEQQALSETGVIKKLVSLLGGSLIQRDASLESLAAAIRDNQEVASKFVGTENGKALNVVIELTKDKYPRTRLLACQVGDESPFLLSSLINEKEDMQKIAFDANAVEKMHEHLKKGSFQGKRLQGILLALADLCTKLECCRNRVLHLKVLDFAVDALAHDSAEVRAAACVFLKNVSRSVKNLSAGHFMNDTVALPLIELLCDSCTSVQIAALRAISNVVVDFKAHKSLFTQSGGVKQLVLLSKSMESAIRVNAVCALKNLTFLANNRCKEEILLELTTSTLARLISDPEAAVQEQALALIRNLISGTLNSIEYVFGEDSLLLHAIGRQLQSSYAFEVLIQGMFTLSNVASGNEFHKEAVMNQLFPSAGNDTESILTKFLQSTDYRLRTAAIWTIVNLIFPSGPGACGRVTELQNAGIISTLKNMTNDPCLDVKLRVRMVLGQLLMFGDTST